MLSKQILTESLSAMVIIKLGIPALTFIMLTPFHNHGECIHTFHIAMIVYIPNKKYVRGGGSVLAYFLKKEHSLWR